MSGLVRCDCGDVFRWAETPAGERIPVNPTPDPAGNLRIQRREGEDLPLARVVPPKHRFGVTLYTSHFATCPNAEKYRRPKNRPPATAVWLIAKTPGDQPYPCLCNREKWGCRAGEKYCPCEGRRVEEHLPAICCARKAAANQKETVDV